MKRNLFTTLQILASCTLVVLLTFCANTFSQAQTLNIITKTSTLQIKTADIDSATVQTTTLSIIKKDKTTQIIAISDIQRMTFTLATGVSNTSNNKALDGLLGLMKAYPNPTSGVTAIEYELSQPTSVEARIVDATGTVIATMNLGTQSIGKHEFQWDATTSSGTIFPNGAYTCVIRTSAGAMLTQKLIILR